jgi:hypothetical protein
MPWDHSIAMSLPRVYRAGQTIEDYCRACKVDRLHTVLVVDGTGRPIRVTCDYCGSQHNFRGGPRTDSPASSPSPAPPPAMPSPSPARVPAPVAVERERSAPPVTVDRDEDDLARLLRRVIREEAGLTPVAIAPKWRGGTLVLKPAGTGLQEKTWPIDTFLHKIVMLRNRLRTLEQQVNASDLPEDAKVKLQAYVTGCYGSLTSFNVLFADEADNFRGSGGD